MRKKRHRPKRHRKKTSEPGDNDDGSAGQQRQQHSVAILFWIGMGLLCTNGRSFVWIESPALEFLQQLPSKGTRPAPVVSPGNETAVAVDVEAVDASVDASVATATTETTEPFARAATAPNGSTTNALPSLEELVDSITNATHPEKDYPCPDGTLPFVDTPLPPAETRTKSIPTVVHVTARSRCVPPAIYRHLEHWRLEGHALYFHDDAAVYRLMKHAILDNAHRGLVPGLEAVLSCATAGATLSDLWRYTLLWYYGGIYTDLDNLPTGFNDATIQPSDDAFFPLESLGIVSQYFMAVSPRHPLALLALKTAVQHLRKTKNTMVNRPDKTTGPNALKIAFVLFQREVGIDTNGYVPAGVYEGALDEKLWKHLESGHRGAAGGANDNIHNNNHNSSDTTSGEPAVPAADSKRTIRVVGNPKKSKEYIHRSGLEHSQKIRYMEKFGMPHYHSDRKRNKGATEKVSCEMHIERQEERIRALNLTLPTTAAPNDDWFPRYQKANYSLDGKLL